MNTHISYAMRNAEAVESFFSLNAPMSLLDWSHGVIELIFLAGFLLTIIHAVRHRRSTGSLSAVYTMAGAFAYGLVMDIISYYTVESFWHGEFTVMLVYNRLPLYIVFLYPTLIYHLIMTLRRYDFSPIVEAVSVGFFGGLMYLIFDNMGPQAGWWIWDMTAPSNQPFISSVPLTSYGWFFLYTGAFAWLSRKICLDWLAENRRPGLIVAGVVTLPVTTIVLGTILFAPYSILAKNVPPWNIMLYRPSLGLATAVHLLSYTAAGMVFVFNFRRPYVGRDRLLMAFPLIYLTGMSYLYVAKFHLFFSAGSEGLSPAGFAMGNLVAAILAIIASMAIVLLSHSAQQESPGPIRV